MVSEEGVGVCVAMDHPHAIARAIATMLAAPTAERLELRRHCREVALSRYTWDRTAGGLVDLYRDLASVAV